MTAGALRVIDGGRAPRGWEALWAKDEWRQLELPHGDLAIAYDREVVLRFDGLAQPWLKEAAKRWARARLLAGLSPRSLDRYLRELMVFSRWLADRDVASPGSISRELLEDYMLFVDSFKTELIADRVWRTRSQLELAIVEYVGWFNTARLHESLGDLPPAEFEALHAPRFEASTHTIKI